ncbi:DUF2268 domain-containing protein [Lentibacillus sp. CBA3610]|uniref:DUF2268 domain-containing protein n=1 Tax=Lentibacillus sp. CBA3610 TaxID=2518176 RepID=UPI0015955F31|nr:DUF2268 domain-containing protein [Lentibacillus sp. CBA3610]QKY68846.1 Zn-dependent protease [Lentibacillus sp. CBA3610]
MSVVRTDKWLLDTYDNPVELCKKLKSYFDENVSASDIHQHMVMHGMYHQPRENGTKLIKALQKRNIWKLVEQEEKALQTEWDGPDIPIFILPADADNRQLRQELNGKSGLTFSDKLFLFITEDNTDKEIRALFTHEYNHACRLAKYSKKEADYVLLDTVILEGLAENAVRERFGKHYTANWTSYYSNVRLERISRNLVLPNQNAPKSSRIHLQILYGLGFYPKMAGYCAGYYFVKHYMESNDLNLKDLLHVPSQKIIEKTDET